MNRQTTLDDLARQHGREAYRSGLNADSYLHDPPYAPGSPASIAFWDGWRRAKDEYTAWADSMCEPAPDTHDETFGL